MGWIAGGGAVPFTNLSYGVVLHTVDGGQTWRCLAGPPGSKTGSQTRLSRIRKVKFFSRDDGVAIGEGSGGEPSGVFVTADGGQSWVSLPGHSAMG